MPKANKPFAFIKMIKSPTPYYAVIFTTTLSAQQEGYVEMAKEMEALARQQPGYLGMDSARADIGITVSYWDSLEAIDRWRNNSLHQKAKTLGKSQWYDSYELKICEVLTQIHKNKHI